MPEEILPQVRTLEQNELIIERGLNTFYEVGNALTDIRDSKQYKDSYSTFEDYCIERWNITRQHANRLISSSKVIEILEPIGSIPNTESQTREISKAPLEEQAQVWLQTQEETGKEQPTAKEIKQVVETGHVHVAQNSGNNEWYTPSAFIESAIDVMGGINLDPASSEIANKTVNADKFHTIDDSGLDAEWTGNIWLNPPYAQPLISDFSDKIVKEIGRFNQLIVLINNATETKWFQKIAKEADCLCFPSSRIKFIDMEGLPKGAPLQGQCFLYFGNNKDKFVSEFSKYGFVVSHA